MNGVTDHPYRIFSLGDAATSRRLQFFIVTLQFENGLVEVCFISALVPWGFAAVPKGILIAVNSRGIGKGTFLEVTVTDLTRKPLKFNKCFDFFWRLVHTVSLLLQYK